MNRAPNPNLNPNPHPNPNLIGEDRAQGVYVDGCTSYYVSSPAELMNAMLKGEEHRATGATRMNEGSSRSHSVFIITVGQTDNTTGNKKMGRLYLVDLAGSEMIRKTGASGTRLGRLTPILTLTLTPIRETRASDTHQ